MTDAQREASWRKQGIDMTVKKYANLLKKQKGVCAICGKPPKGLKLAVDHDHKTGRIRGLLCAYCNYFHFKKRKRNWKAHWRFVNYAKRQKKTS